MALYDVLIRPWPLAGGALNRAVAVGFAGDHGPGWPRSTRSRASRSSPGYGYLPAARADLLRRLGRVPEAREAYAEALLLTENAVEREFLDNKLRSLPDS